MHAATLYANCDERTQTVTLSGSDIEGRGRIYNYERWGTRYWNYEGRNRVVKLNSNYTGDFNLTLESFACSEHFNYYYTTEGKQSVSRNYVEQIATQLETAWTELVDAQGFRSPLSLKAEGRYETFTDFIRIPVLIHDSPDGKSGGNRDPRISLIRSLTSNSRTPNHELFHIIKHGYTRFNAPWFNEGLARWSERFVAGGGLPCGGFYAYTPLTYNLLTRDYCDSARFFNYLGIKYGTALAGSDGSDVIRSILEETGDALSDQDAMSGIERALDDFRGHRSAYGTAYKEWAKGNYVDDTGNTPEMRFTAPQYTRPKEAGEVGTGANTYVWHDYTFNNPSRGAVTIQIRAAAGDLDGDGDDDDLRFLLDGTLLGNWNSANAFDGSSLGGNIRTIHIVSRNLAAGDHTLRLEADEHPILLAINVFSGEIPLLRQDSDLFKWCRAGGILGGVAITPCFSRDSDSPILSTTFDIPDGGSRARVLLEGRAGSGAQNEALGFPKNDDDARILVDGQSVEYYESEFSLDGDFQEEDLAAVAVETNSLQAGSHTLEIRTQGTPNVDHVAVYVSPNFQPLLRLQGSRLSPWSTNYHVIPVTSELLPQNAEVLARDLEIQVGTRAWSDVMDPPFHHILLIDNGGNLYQSFSSDASRTFSRTITSRTLERLGQGGRVVVVVGSRESSGTYFVQIRR